MASASNVLDTAISVTDFGSRDASRHMRSISARTADRPELRVVIVTAPLIPSDRIIKKTGPERRGPGASPGPSLSIEPPASSRGLPVLLGVLARLVQMHFVVNFLHPGNRE